MPSPFTSPSLLRQRKQLKQSRQAPPLSTSPMTPSLVPLILFTGCAYGFTVPTKLQQPSIISARSSTLLRSIPNSIDTLTSGLASIARLPRGVTVSSDGVSLVGPAAPFLPKIKQLYDVENNRDCRVVRERVTEYDLVVEKVIPASANSRSMAEETITVPTMVVEVDGKEQTFTGVDSILSFLDDKFSTVVKKYDAREDRSDEVGEEDTVELILDKANDFLAYLPGVLRGSRGRDVCSAASMAFDVPRPTKPLVLYSYEGKRSYPSTTFNARIIC